MANFNIRTLLTYILKKKNTAFSLLHKYIVLEGINHNKKQTLRRYHSTFYPKGPK